MIETALNEKFYPHVRKHVNEQTAKAFHKILDLRKENVVMESREAEKLLSVTGKTANGNAAVINQEFQFLCDVVSLLSVVYKYSNIFSFESSSVMVVSRWGVRDGWYLSPRLMSLPPPLPHCAFVHRYTVYRAWTHFCHRNFCLPLPHPLLTFWRRHCLVSG